jgi:hypothetical protein
MFPLQSHAPYPCPSALHCWYPVPPDAHVQRSQSPAAHGVPLFVHAAKAAPHANAASTQPASFTGSSYIGRRSTL